mgnify:CR=1 FL=1
MNPKIVFLTFAMMLSSTMGFAQGSLLKKLGDKGCRGAFRRGCSVSRFGLMISAKPDSYATLPKTLSSAVVLCPFAPCGPGSESRTQKRAGLITVPPGYSLSGREANRSMMSEIAPSPVTLQAVPKLSIAI